MSEFNLLHEIPKHRIVEIRDRNGSITGKHYLILKDGFSIKVNSKYGQLWEAQPNNMLTLLSTKSKLVPSGQFALQGAQIWNSTDPIQLTINVSLEMDTDPYTDVIVPCLDLMKLTVPSIAKDGNKDMITSGLESIAEGLSGTNVDFKTLIPCGPDLDSLLSIMSSNDSSQSKANALLKKRNSKQGLLTAKIGFATFNNVVLTSVEPTFSGEVAISRSNGNKAFPVSADLSIEMSTIEIATTDMLDTIVQ